MGRPEFYRRLQRRFTNTLQRTEWHSGIILAHDTQKFSKLRDFILFHIEPGTGRLHTFGALLDFLAHHSPVIQIYENKIKNFNRIIFPG